MKIISKYGTECLSFREAHLWEKIPLEIKNCSLLFNLQFKSMIKTWIDQNWRWRLCKTFEPNLHFVLMNTFILLNFIIVFYYSCFYELIYNAFTGNEKTFRPMVFLIICGTKFFYKELRILALIRNRIATYKKRVYCYCQANIQSSHGNMTF